MVPELPRRCLHGQPDEPCLLRVAFYRARKTGPSFPIAVLKCETHRRASTLYPPGHVPYGRVAVAPVDAHGELLVRRADGAAAEPGAPWEATIFEAAVDAAAGSLWRKDFVSPGIEDVQLAVVDFRHRRTQGRHLSVAAGLLGIDPSLDPSLQEAVARALAVPCLELRKAAHDLKSASCYRDEGCVIVRVLMLLHPARCLTDQLLAAGKIVGLWGTPRRWDPGGRRPHGRFRGSVAQS